MQLLGDQKIAFRAGNLSSKNGTCNASDKTTKMDTFILQRKSNFVPELIFN